jgi:hypothetical protein
MGEGADSPGVRLPPPLLYAAAVIGGLLLNRRWALAIGAGGFGRVLASLLIAAWAVVTAISFQSFWRMHTSIVPIRPATALVIGGAYRFTRNVTCDGASAASTMRTLDRSAAGSDPAACPGRQVDMTSTW